MPWWALVLGECSVDSAAQGVVFGLRGVPEVTWKLVKMQIPGLLQNANVEFFSRAWESALRQLIIIIIFF